MQFLPFSVADDLCVACVYSDAERKFHVIFVPENECSMTFSLPGTKVLASESSCYLLQQVSLDLLF